MKRLPVIFIPIIFTSFVIISLLSYSVVFSQDFDYNRAFDDYVYNYNLYRSNHLDYISTKSEYQTYGTLTAKTQALEAMRALLKQRDEVIKTYLTALRMKLKEETGVETYRQNLYFVKLDDEITWLKENQSFVSTPSTIEDLNDLSEKLENRFPYTLVIAYQTLGTINEGKLNRLREKVNQEITATEEKIEEIRSYGEEEPTIERWLIEAKQKVVLSNEKQREAMAIINSLEPSSRDKASKYDQARHLFEESNQYLKESVSYLKEIIREIKRV